MTSEKHHGRCTCAAEGLWKRWRRCDVRRLSQSRHIKADINHIATVVACQPNPTKLTKLPSRPYGWLQVCCGIAYIIVNCNCNRNSSRNHQHQHVSVKLTHHAASWFARFLVTLPLSSLSALFDRRPNTISLIWGQIQSSTIVTMLPFSSTLRMEDS